MIHWELYKQFGFDNIDKQYEHKPEVVFKYKNVSYSGTLSSNELIHPSKEIRSGHCEEGKEINSVKAGM